MDSWHIKVAAFIGFAAHAKLARFESTGASALHCLPFGFNPSDASHGDARQFDRQRCADYATIRRTVCKGQ